MTLSRWRRIATGIAAGVIVLCAALLGASLRTDTSGVAVASDLRPSVIIPIEEDPIETTTTDDTATDDADAAADDTVTDAAAGSEEDSVDSEPVQVIETDDLPADTEDPADTENPADGGTEDTDADPAPADADEPAEAADTPVDEAPADEAPVEEAPAEEAPAAAEEPAPAPAAPLTSSDDNLGTGGGVDDAECALDRLVIYAGARRGGVAGSIRAALTQAGFAAGCPTPVTVLASNCPLQFAGVLGAGSGYDPAKSYVASSASLDRETMTAVMGTVGYSGSAIDILDFSFVNPDRPGEQWMAIFIPSTFAGWEDLASRAGLSPTAQSLCAPSGELAG